MNKLTFQQYQELQSALDDAASASIENVGGRHALLIALLYRLGTPVISTQEAVSKATKLLEKGWANENR